MTKVKEGLDSRRSLIAQGNLTSKADNTIEVDFKLKGFVNANKVHFESQNVHSYFLKELIQQKDDCVHCLAKSALTSVKESLRTPEFVGQLELA